MGKLGLLGTFVVCPAQVPGSEKCGAAEHRRYLPWRLHHEEAGSACVRLHGRWPPAAARRGWCDPCCRYGRLVSELFR